MTFFMTSTKTILRQFRHSSAFQEKNSAQWRDEVSKQNSYATVILPSSEMKVFGFELCMPRFPIELLNVP